MCCDDDDGVAAGARVGDDDLGGSDDAVAVTRVSDKYLVYRMCVSTHET